MCTCVCLSWIGVIMQNWKLLTEEPTGTQERGSCDVTVHHVRISDNSEIGGQMLEWLPERKRKAQVFGELHTECQTSGDQCHLADPTQEAFKVFIMSRRTHCIGTFREFGYLGSLLPNNFYIVRSLMWTFQGHCLWIFLFQSTKISLLVYIRGVRAHRRQAAWGDSEHFLSPWAKNENSCFPQSFDISCLRKLYKSWEEKAKGKKGFSNMWKDTGYFPLMMTWVWYHV